MATKTKTKEKKKVKLDLDKVEAYCVKCQKKRIMEKAKKVTMKNGRDAVKGKCSKCDTGMYRIL